MDDRLSPLPAAPLWRRLAAQLYDSLLLAAILLVASALILVPVALLKPSLPGLPTDPSLLGGWLGQQSWFRLYLLAWISGFYLWFWRHGGQTLGMRAWRLRLQPVPAAYSNLMIRLLTAAFGLANLPLLLGLPAWHDHVSQTRLVVEPKLRKSED